MPSTKLLQKIRRRWQPAPDALIFRLVGHREPPRRMALAPDRLSSGSTPIRDSSTSPRPCSLGLSELRQWLETRPGRRIALPGARSQVQGPPAPPQARPATRQLDARAGSSSPAMAEVRGKERVNWVELDTKPATSSSSRRRSMSAASCPSCSGSERTAVLTSATLGRRR